MLLQNLTIKTLHDHLWCFSTLWKIKCTEPSGFAPNKSISSWIIEDESPENLHSRKKKIALHSVTEMWMLLIAGQCDQYKAKNNSQIQTFQVNVHNRPHNLLLVDNFKHRFNCCRVINIIHIYSFNNGAILYNEIIINIYWT